MIFLVQVLRMFVFFFYQVTDSVVDCQLEAIRRGVNKRLIKIIIKD